MPLPIARLIAVHLALAFCLAGCAQAKVIPKGGDGRDVGFRFYDAAPHLVITKKKDGFEATIVSLPDLNNPYRLKITNGWGTQNVSFTLQHGVLTNFNRTTDSKGPETIEAVGGLVSQVAGAAATLGAFRQGNDIKPIKQIASAIRTDVVTPIDTALNTNPSARLSNINVRIGQLADRLDDLAAMTDSFEKRFPDIAIAARSSELRKEAKTAGGLADELKAFADGLNHAEPHSPLVKVATDAAKALGKSRTKLDALATKSVPDVLIYRIKRGKNEMLTFERIDL